ncbi:MAG TPA: phenylalanine--tRNA ligase subunit beta, partial [Candidatus Paceibacterota bacterium]|nr:phenylalanine--tRNA ligase subunit beta [Candidatus Paceibacterota bacterium]
MKISYNWLREYLPKLPKPEKLANLLIVHSLEVKAIEKLARDYILDIDVLPNRGHDCLSYIGIAKECAALLGLKITQPCLPVGRRKYKLEEDKKLKTSDFIKIEVQDREACPRYTARVIDNIKIGPSPKWLKEKLESIGQKSINNIVDATNYIMFETGQPLHAFDYEKISGRKIIVRQAKKGEKIATLDNELIDLDDDFLVIADTKNPLALAGIKGGKRAEISKNTKTIVLESANFNLGTVRTASRKINLRTEASIRFEYGLDANLTGEAIDKVAVLIKEVAEGKIARGIIDVYAKKVYPIKINLDIKKVENILGKTISKTEITRILKLLGFDVDANLKVVIPTIRQDVKIQEDLIEEIARIIGYDNIEAKAPLGLLGIVKLDDVLTITNKTKTIL